MCLKDFYKYVIITKSSFVIVRNACTGFGLFFFMPIQWEQQECEAFADYLRLKNIKFAHIANESGMRLPMGVIRKRARMGYGKGVPDYLVVVNNDLLFIEMKREKGGIVSPEQKEWIELLNKINGVTALVCRGAMEAINSVEKYLKQ